MPQPYSEELRNRVMHAYEVEGMSQREVAQVFEISRTTLVYWIRLRRETGQLSPRAHGGGGVARVSRERVEEVLRELPDGTRGELCALYNRKVARSERVHVSSFYRALRRNNYVIKKNGHGRWNKNDHK